MTFQDPRFYLFFALTWGLWALLRPAQRPGALLAASLLFYASFGKPVLWVALGLCAGGSWSLAPRIAVGAQARERWLGLGILLNLGVLASLRFGASVQPGFFTTLGVSYFSLQAIAYLCDVYFERQAPERSLGRVTLFLAFFPKLVQGPFERCQGLLNEIDAGSRSIDLERLRAGLLLLAWGLFQKAVVADRAAVGVDHLFAHLEGGRFFDLLLAAPLFTLQLFADFSGYTDMALGAALCFGVQMHANFAQPFLATSIADFWRRWHASFSDWIRDYLFEPLQMAFRGMAVAGTALALFLSFSLVGLWHGTGAGYLCFYLAHASLLSLAVFWRPWQKKLWKALGLEKSAWQRWWRTLVILAVTIALNLVFRAADLKGLKLLAGVRAGSWDAARASLEGLYNAMGCVDAAVCALGVLAMVVVSLLSSRIELLKAPLWLRWTAYASLALGLLFLGRYFGARQFIYAQF